MPSGELRAAGGGIPLVVDEGCHTLRDVAEVATYADGVNLKLAKTGGIREAVRMVHAARALGLVVMLGLHDRELRRHLRRRAVRVARATSSTSTGTC